MSLVHDAEGAGSVGDGDVVGGGNTVGGGSATGSVAVHDPATSLGDRLGVADRLVGGVVDDLELAVLSDHDPVALYMSAVGIERRCLAIKTLVGGHIDESGLWRDGGHRNAAAMLALLEGVPTGRARATLELGDQLAKLPATKEAFRAGTLSAAKAAELASAASLDPEREAELLAGAADQSFHQVRERAQRARATSARRDPLAAVRRIHAKRGFRSWTDAEGAFCYQGTDTADRGAQIMASINHVADVIGKRRKAGSGEPEPRQALCADALCALVTGQVQLAGQAGGGASSGNGEGGGSGEGGGEDSGATSDGGNGSDEGGDAGNDPRTSDRGPGLDPSTDAYIVDLDTDPGFIAGGSTDGSGGTEPIAGGTDTGLALGSIITRPPTCSVMVRVDLEALLRGHALPGELCEIDGQGPIPVAMACQMANDSFLRLVFTRAGDIAAISHLGRTINAKLRTALAHRDRTCVVPHCGISFGLEIDHIRPVVERGPTELDNLALLCHHHHFLKTHDGWVLTKHEGPPGHGPTWTFVPQPPFGQEPDLGIDTPQARVAWHADQGRGSRGPTQLFDPG